MNSQSCSGCGTSHRVLRYLGGILSVTLCVLTLAGCFKVKYTMTSPSKDVVIKVLDSCMYADCGVRLRLLADGIESELAGRADCWLEFATAAWIQRSNVVVILVSNGGCPDIFMAYDTFNRQETALEPYISDFERHLRKEFRLSSADLAEHRNSAIAWALDSQVGQEEKMRYRQDQ